MPQSDPLQFKSAKLFKGYKPIICVKLISYATNDTYRFGSKYEIPTGDYTARIDINNDGAVTVATHILTSTAGGFTAAGVVAGDFLFMEESGENYGFHLIESKDADDQITIYNTFAATQSNIDYKILPASHVYRNIIKSLPSISRSLKRFGGMSSIGSISFSILNQEKYSDLLRTGGGDPQSTDGLGLAMGTALVSLLFDDGTTVTWAERLELFTGIVDDFNFDYEILRFSIIDNDKTKNKTIGTLLVTNDYSNLIERDIGKIKPLPYGDNTLNIGNTTRTSFTMLKDNNLVPMIYLGLDSSNNHRWMISEKKVNTINSIWAYDQQLEKYVQLSSYNTESNTNALGCIITHANNPNFYDYHCGDGTISGADQSANATQFSNPTRMGDKLATLESIGSVDLGSVPGNYVEIGIDFPSWKIQNINEDQIISIRIYAFIKKSGTYSNFATDFKFEISDDAGANWDNQTLNIPDSDAIATWLDIVIAGTLENIDDTILIKLSNAAALLTETASITCYELYKQIRYKPTNFMPLYASIKGICYDTWINGRSTAETDPNTDLNYTVNHPDDDGNGNLIENPVGAIESVARDLMGFENSDIEMNSFNVAADARSSYKFSFAIMKQIDAIKLLSQMAFECGCWLFWNYANRLEILAYDSSPDFSVSGGATPISDDIFIHQPEIHAIDFDNSDNAIITFSATADHQITGLLTFECWAYFNSFIGSNYLAGCQGNVASELEADNCLYRFYFSASNTVVCIHEYGAGIDEVTTITLDASLDTATWYHISIRRVGSAYYVYVYDIEATLIASGYTVYSNAPTGGGNATLAIGNQDTNYNMNGKIKEIRLWNVNRSVSELTNNLWKILIGNEANLVGYWRLDEGALTNVDDITANDHDGTVNLTGCTWSTGETYPDLGYYAQHPIIKDSFSIRLVGTKDLANNLTLNYYKNYRSGNHQKTCSLGNNASITKYGMLRETLNIDFIRDLDTAHALRGDLLTRKKEKYYIATFKTWLNAANKLEGDTINIRHPLLDTGIMTNAQMIAHKWQIIAIKHLLNSCEIEIKAISLSVP